MRDYSSFKSWRLFRATFRPLSCSLRSLPPEKTVVSEKYDEVVFTNPKAGFHQSLASGNVKKLPYPLSNEESVAEHFRTYGDEEEMKAMLAAKLFLEGELRNVKERLLRADAELEGVKRSLSAARGGSDAATVTSAGTTGTAGPSSIGGTGIEVGGAAGGPGGSGAGAGKAAVAKPTKKAASMASSDSEPAGKKAKSS